MIGIFGLSATNAFNNFHRHAKSNEFHSFAESFFSRLSVKIENHESVMIFFACHNGPLRFRFRP
jgi:hypothetical protein